VAHRRERSAPGIAAAVSSPPTGRIILNAVNAAPVRVAPLPGCFRTLGPVSGVDLPAIDWSAFVPAAVLVSLVPGANQVLSLRHAARYGTADAATALVGRLAAFVLLVAGVAAGLGALLTRSAVVLDVVRWVGVVYLAWLGLVALLRPAHDGAGARAVSRSALIRREFLTAVTNPKAFLLFAAFLPQFVPASAAGPATLAVLGCAYIGVEAVSALVYTLVGARLNGLRRMSVRGLDRIAGVAFLGLAAWLAVEERA
jgi:threonine/homoserine/homoserine lactone efflux protein